MSETLAVLCVLGVGACISLVIVILVWITWLTVRLIKIELGRWCTECLRPCDEDGYCDPCAIKAVERQRTEKCCNCPSPDERLGDERCACGCRCHDPKEWRALKVGGWWTNE